MTLCEFLRAVSFNTTSSTSDKPHNSASSTSLFFPRANLQLFQLLAGAFSHTTATPTFSDSSQDPSDYKAKSDLFFWVSDTAAFSP